MASREFFGDVMQVLMDAWPKEPITEQRLDVYFRLLADVPDPVLEAAALQCLASCRFFPTIAELREAVFAMLPQANALTAGEAWAEVMREIRRTGADQHHGPPQFSSPVVAETVASLGWRNLCLSENEVADRAHFMRVYDSLANRVQSQIRMLPQVRQVAAALTVGTVKMLAEPAPPEDNGHEQIS